MKAIWRQPLGLEECPYAYRWVLPIPFTKLSIRLHQWLADDDHRSLHDHPTWFCTFVLRGGYCDVKIFGSDLLTAGSFRFRAATHCHQVLDVKPNTWTLCLFGNPIRKWGFYLNNTQKRIPRDKYFAEQGHHPCDGAVGPVRLRPDRTRII
jgi:hypothetical protein